jgi:hypothetical protein
MSNRFEQSARAGLKLAARMPGCSLRARPHMPWWKPGLVEAGHRRDIPLRSVRVKFRRLVRLAAYYVGHQSNATMWDHQSQTPLFIFCAVDTLPSGVQLI